MAYKPYWELLQDPRWQKRRLQVLEAANWLCEECGSNEEQLHVHHKIYRKRKLPWDYEIWEYRTLCKSCHEEETILRGQIAELMVFMDMDGLTELQRLIRPIAEVWVEKYEKQRSAEGF